MFRDIGDKFGLIQAQIGVAKCLAQCKRFRDSMNSYQLAVTSCHETDNKVRIAHFDFVGDELLMPGIASVAILLTYTQSYM